MLRGGLFLTVALSAALAQTQGQKPEPEAPSIKVQVNEVIVPVTVTDYKGRFISNLDRPDFKIFENGREQKIKYFNREHNQPVVLGFLLDLSNGSRLHWKNFQETAMEMVWTLLSQEKGKEYSGFLVTYAFGAGRAGLERGVLLHDAERENTFGGAARHTLHASGHQPASAGRRAEQVRSGSIPPRHVGRVPRKLRGSSQERMNAKGKDNGNEYPASALT